MNRVFECRKRDFTDARAGCKRPGSGAGNWSDTRNFLLTSDDNLINFNHRNGRRNDAP